jgi:hypothetical protein
VQFQELNGDQRREVINTRQRYAALRQADIRAKGYRGSMVWTEAKGRSYLARSTYGPSGARRQTSLGPRSEETESLKREFDQGREEAQARLKNLKAVLARQSAINRAIGLGRVPLIGAKIVRTLDQAALMGSSIRVLGTYAIYAYEAAAGIHVGPELTTTDDIYLLFDARGSVTFAADETISHPSLLRLLQKVDRSFERSKQTFRAVNAEGYFVDLIKPVRNPPWREDKRGVGTEADDLLAVEIEGLGWHENAPAFEAVAIDEKGEPFSVVTTDPRVWVAHKHWLSKRQDREPLRRRRDEIQARTVARLVTEYLPHLPYAADELRMLPKDVFAAAVPLFGH